MFTVTFLNVGDGACAVYRGGMDPFLQPRQVMVVDCGTSGKHTSAQAAFLLDRELGDLNGPPETIVVSHFDADHWTGLHQYAIGKEPGKPFSGEPVQLVYPMLPRPVSWLSALMSAFVTVESGYASVSALDLKRAWTDTGAIVTAQPMSAGQSFRGADQKWNVLWPPKELPRSWRTAAARILKEAGELAAKIPALDQAFKEAYGELWRSDSDETTASPRGDEAWSDARTRLEETGGYDDEQHEPDTEDEQDGEAFPSDADDDEIQDQLGGEMAPGLRELSEELALEYQKVRGDLQRMNNGLSLVIAAGQSVLTYGDAEKWALTRLASSGLLLRSYGLIVAPHHGTATLTQKAARGFPRADVVVSQNGHERHNGYNKWYDRVPRTPFGSYSTHRDGNLTFWLGDFSCDALLIS